MNKNDRFRIAGPNIVHQTIGGETIILSLEKGHYYSLLKSGVVIWEGIEKGMTLDEITDLLYARFDTPKEELKKIVEAMVRQFVDEGLVIPCSDQQPTIEVSSSQKAPDPSNKEGLKKKAFEPPVFQKFTDMEELLLLDPIHEVDVAGWPNAKSVDVEKKAPSN